MTRKQRRGVLIGGCLAVLGIAVRNSLGMIKHYRRLALAPAGTTTDEAAIRDVFEFVVDDCQVDIVETTGPADGGEEEAFGLFTENMPYVPPGQLTVDLPAAPHPLLVRISRQSNIVTGSQRRTCCISCRTLSALVLGRRGPRRFSGQQRAVKQGNAHTRRLQGTGTKSIIDTHFRPKQRMTCFLLDRTASRSQPLAVLLRPERRSTVSSAPSTMCSASHLVCS